MEDVFKVAAKKGAEAQILFEWAEIWRWKSILKPVLQRKMTWTNPYENEQETAKKSVDGIELDRTKPNELKWDEYVEISLGAKC